MASTSSRLGDGHTTRAPPPTPIATGKGIRSAAVDDHVLSEYLERSLRVPDLALPERASAPASTTLRLRRIPAAIDLPALLSGDEESAARLLASAAEVGAFRIDGHGVSEGDLQGVVEAAAGVFEVSGDERGALGWCLRRRGGAREEFRWFRPARWEDEAAVLGIWPGSYVMFREKLDIMCNKLERVAESLGAILSVNTGVPPPHGEPEKNRPPAVLCLRKYSFQLFSDPGCSGDAAGELTAGEPPPHALSLHLLGGNREFVIQSDEGPVPFPVPSGSIVVTLSRELQELSNGGFKGVDGEPIFELSSDVAPSFSLEYMCSPGNLGLGIEKNRGVSLMDQLLIVLVLALLHKLWAWAFSA